MCSAQKRREKRKISLERAAVDSGCEMVSSNEQARIQATRGKRRGLGGEPYSGLRSVAPAFRPSRLQIDSRQVPITSTGASQAGYRRVPPTWV